MLLPKPPTFYERCCEGLFGFGGLLRLLLWDLGVKGQELILACA